jgi:hypothetical protein
MTLKIDLQKELDAAFPKVRAVLDSANHTRQATWASTLPHQAMSAKKIGERFHEAFNLSSHSASPALTWLRRQGLLIVELPNNRTGREARYKRAKERLLVPFDDLQPRTVPRKKVPSYKDVKEPLPQPAPAVRLKQLATNLQTISEELTRLANEVFQFEEAMTAAAHAFNAIHKK